VTAQAKRARGRKRLQARGNKWAARLIIFREQIYSSRPKPSKEKARAWPGMGRS
jgi:hypothetical protein